MAWRNVELARDGADSLRAFLKDKGIRYEASQCYNLVHFEIYCDDEVAGKINAFLEGL